MTIDPDDTELKDAIARALYAKERYEQAAQMWEFAASHRKFPPLLDDRKNARLKEYEKALTDLGLHFLERL